MELKPLLVHTLILDAAGISFIDATAMHTLEDIVEDHSGKKKIRVFLADVKGPVITSLKSSGMDTKIGHDNFFFSVHDAVEHALELHKQDIEKLAKEEEEKKKKEEESQPESVVALEENGQEEIRKSMDGRRSLVRSRSSEGKPSSPETKKRIPLHPSVILEKIRELNPEVDLWKGEKVEAWV